MLNLRILFLMIKWSIYQEDIAFVNIYAPNVEAPKYIKQY